MSYFYMSNISNFNDITNPNDSYQEVNIHTSPDGPESTTNGVIKFSSTTGIDYSASFLMIRARYDNDLLIELNPSHYGVYIPANELWSVDSLEGIDKFYIRNIFKYRQDGTSYTTDTGYIQWMIGYK